MRAFQSSRRLRRRTDSRRARRSCFHVRLEFEVEVVSACAIRCGCYRELWSITLRQPVAIVWSCARDICTVWSGLASSGYFHYGWSSPMSRVWSWSPEISITARVDCCTRVRFNDERDETDSVPLCRAVQSARVPLLGLVRFVIARRKKPMHRRSSRARPLLLNVWSLAGAV